MLNMLSSREYTKADSAPNGALPQANHADARRAKAWLDDRIKRGRREAFCETINLTPALAELLLGRNPDNRNLRQSKVDEFCTDIAAGNWTYNGENIKVSVEGLLNDGQHRCHAVIAAATPIKTDIKFGLSRDSRMTVDQGAVRTAGNYLSMGGVTDANAVAAVAGFVWQYETYGKISTARNGRPTKAQISDTFRRHPKIAESVRAVPRGGRVAGSKAVLAFCHYPIARKASVLADSFILNLCIGEGLVQTDPVYRCRERLLADRKLSHSEKIELILRTWNATRTGRRAVKTSHIVGEIPELER